MTHCQMQRSKTRHTCNTRKQITECTTAICNNANGTVECNKAQCNSAQAKIAKRIMRNFTTSISVGSSAQGPRDAKLCLLLSAPSCWEGRPPSSLAFPEPSAKCLIYSQSAVAPRGTQHHVRFLVLPFVGKVLLHSSLGAFVDPSAKWVLSSQWQ